MQLSLALLLDGRRRVVPRARDPDERRKPRHHMADPQNRVVNPSEAVLKHPDGKGGDDGLHSETHAGTCLPAESRGEAVARVV